MTYFTEGQLKGVIRILKDLHEQGHDTAVQAAYFAMNDVEQESVIEALEESGEEDLLLKLLT